MKKQVFPFFAQRVGVRLKILRRQRQSCSSGCAKWEAFNPIASRDFLLLAHVQIRLGPPRP